MPPKRRRRFQGLYYHSSPPKVLSMNSGVSNQNLQKRRDVDDFSVKLSTIRIWMHEKDIGKLTRILWAGQGNRLRQQASTNAKVKRFLAAVPYVMNSIKDVHQSVIDNNLETLQANLDPPVPPALITCKDANGLNVIHKAAGLGHAMILEYLIGVWPDGAHETDITGKTPLHWAASCKNNMRCYTLLTQAGCDEEAQDYKMKTPSYYRHKPHDIERAFLVYVPEAPRVSPDVATDWDALSEDTGDGKKLDIKIPDNFTNGFHDRSNDNISEADVIEGEIEMHEDELRPDEDEANVDVEPTAEETETHEAEAEPEPELEAEPEEPQEIEVEATAESEISDEPETKDEATDENISNDMNDTSTTPTTTNTQDAAKNQEEEEEANEDGDRRDDNGDHESPDSTQAVNENNDDKEEETLETNGGDNDAKNNEEKENNETLATTEEVHESHDKIEKSKQEINEEEGAHEEGAQEEETNAETKDIAETTDEEKLDETVMIEAFKIPEEGTNETVENDKEILTENGNEEFKNDDHSITENKEELIKDETYDVEKDNKSQNGGNEQEQVEETNTEDVTTNATEETENDADKGEKSNGFDAETELDKITNETEDDDEKNDNENTLNQEEISPNLSQETEINNNAQEKIMQETESTNEAAEEVTKSEENNDEIIEKKNAENEKRLQSASSIKSLGKVLQENGTITNEKNHSAGSVRSSKDEDDDDDKDDDDDDQDNKVENATDPSTENGKKEFDENHNEEHYEVDSPTSSLAIEGYVQGESEDNTVQSQSAAYVDEESRIQGIIASGDMEQLAQIVLNGDGNKLLNMQAPEPEIQAFLNNVSNYMNKIRRVHQAARDGNIMALQQALDRRKFAIAKDDISPNGSSPLHVAVLFGHADIVRYLAARFPETTTVTDDDGRTALHYAATIRDNGHFYNVLMQLGSNPLAVDKLGHTPKFYLEPEEAKDILTYRQLLETFGAAELEKELLNDQVPDDQHSSRRELSDSDTEHTLDRCFSVIQESNKLLSGATASALTQRKPLSASALQVSVTSYLSRFLKQSVYEKIKKRQTRLDHNLFDVIWPAMRKTSKLRHLEEDVNCGIIAPDFDVYVVFQEFLVPLIKDMHCMCLTSDFKPHPRLAYFPMEAGERLNTAAFVYDDESNLIQRCVVECSRNLEAYELPLNLTIGQIEQAERLMMGKIFNVAFAHAMGDTESGNYYTLNEIIEKDSEVQVMLARLGLMIPLLDIEDTVQAAESMAFNGSLWPYGRGVFINSQNNLALWLNCQEHLRAITTTNANNPADMGAAYTRIGRAISYLDRELHFKESYLLGYLQARPSYLGTGLKMITILRLPNLMKEMDNLRHLCSVRGLSLITNPKTNLTVRLVNMQSLGTIEYVLFQDYCSAVTNILSLEKDMSLTNSKQIASMLVKIFRRHAEGNCLETNPIFKTEQGKYLASTLAEPLTKALTEIANLRPEDPVAFLANFLKTYVRDVEINGHLNSSKTDSTAVIEPLVSPEKLPPAPKTMGVGSGKISHSQMNGNIQNVDEKIDEIEEDPTDSPDDTSQPKLEDRDEHGQSMLHFSSARSHRRGGLLHMIEESKIDITYRDELYRTARDVSLQANQPANAKEIDHYVLSLAIVGDLAPFEYLALQGYDHIIDVVNDEGEGIIDVATAKGHDDLVDFLKNIRSLEEQREELHECIRANNIIRVHELTSGPNGKWLIRAKNYYGRTALHIAVLKESEEIVQHFVGLCPEALKIGDNLERNALHYAMGTNAVETISRILIQKGAKRTNKDLKGRQPTYYFMNKADILRLQEEEDENR